MFKFFAIIFVALFMISCGSAPQYVDIISQPSGAFIEVNGESVGKTPCTYEIPKWVDASKPLKFIAKKSNYEADMKSLSRDSRGNFPKQIAFVLDPVQKEAEKTVSSTHSNSGSGGGNVTPTVTTPVTVTPTITGPTIVIPPSSGGPIFNQPTTTVSKNEHD
ncbi:MAG: PEGA domain-containing protein [Candidatus Brocadiae bacterium]|nr:PEGA domain-containing protein [Candidatus Brocadiia bacterium]